MTDPQKLLQDPPIRKHVPVIKKNTKTPAQFPLSRSLSSQRVPDDIGEFRKHATFKFCRCRSLSALFSLNENACSASFLDHAPSLNVGHFLLWWPGFVFAPGRFHHNECCAKYMPHHYMRMWRFATRFTHELTPPSNFRCENDAYLLVRNKNANTIQLSMECLYVNTRTLSG